MRTEYWHKFENLCNMLQRKLLHRICQHTKGEYRYYVQAIEVSRNTYFSHNFSHYLASAEWILISLIIWWAKSEHRYHMLTILSSIFGKSGYINFVSALLTQGHTKRGLDGEGRGAFGTGDSMTTNLSLDRCWLRGDLQVICGSNPALHIFAGEPFVPEVNNRRPKRLLTTKMRPAGCFHLVRFWIETQVGFGWS